MAVRVYVGAQIRINPIIDKFTNWCKENLEVDNPEYAKKKRLGLWLGKTPKKLKLYEIDNEDHILTVPFGVLKKLPIYRETVMPEFDHIRTRVFESKHPYELLDYQEVAVKEMVKAKFGILESPAGSGKTMMAMALIQRLGLQTLWITHTNDLVDQSYERAKYLFKNEDKGIRKITSDNIKNDPIYKLKNGRLYFTTIQTLNACDLSRIYNLFDCIIVDECHHVSGSASNATMYYRVLSQLKSRHKYGLSATLHREDGLIACTYALLGDVIHTVDKEDCKERIQRVGVKFIDTKTPLTYDCLDTSGRISFTKTINYLTTNENRNQLIVEELKEHWTEITILLSDRVEHLNTIYNMLPQFMQFRAVILTAKTPKDTRKQILDDMRIRKCRYLLATYQLAKEGIDIPVLERAYFLTPHKDKTCIIQCVGRVARVAEKNPPVVVDFVDSGRYFEKIMKERIRYYKQLDCYEFEEPQLTPEQQAEEDANREAREKRNRKAGVICK